MENIKQRKGSFMSKKDILKTLDLACMISIVIATILVVIFEFVGEYNVIKFAVVMYTASFLILLVFHSLKLYFSVVGTEEDGVKIVEQTRKEKVFLISKLVLSAIAFVLTLVILILY